MKSIVKLISLLTKKEQRRLIPITIAILCASVLGIVEVGSLGSFIAVAANPDAVNNQRVLAFLYQLGGFDSRNSSNNDFLIFLGIVIFILVILITAFKTVVSYIDYRFIANRRYTLSVRLFRQYMFQPYQYFLNQNSGELSKNLLSEVDMVINHVLRPAVDAFKCGMTALAIIIFLVVLNPVVAALAAGIFGILYFGVYIFVRSKLTRHGKDARESNRMRFKITSEAFGGIKDVKILGKELFFSEAYRHQARRFAVSQAAKHLLTTLPGQVMHSLTMGFAIVLMVILLILSGSLVEILPLLAIYSFATVRLVPNFQHIFSSAAQIRYHAHTVDALYHDMTVLTLPAEISFKGTSSKSNFAGKVFEPMPFARSIELKGLQFSYPASMEPVLKGIDLTIAKNSSVAFAGTTGCGKTTLVDVIMGLLEPAGGLISVDGIPVITSPDGNDNRMKIAPWQRNFGYVPQHIFLCDDTVAANIAFGIPENLRDADAVEQAAKVANLHEFIIRDLPNGYTTKVGERGIRLSGGQRQRVGIARALYHDPSILVMDEATSALDSVTEDAVMEAIHSLMHTRTIIIIAHRLTTIQECDVIYLMDRGRIKAEGTYEELLQCSAQFRSLARAENNSKLFIVS
jgi:ABC-type multidrug transport system fused ATPase/permease subunit